MFTHLPSVYFFPFVLVTSFWQARGIGGSPWILNIGGSFQSLLESTVKLFFLGQNLEVKGFSTQGKKKSSFLFYQLTDWLLLEITVTTLTL